MSRLNAIILSAIKLLGNRTLKRQFSASACFCNKVSFINSNEYESKRQETVESRTVEFSSSRSRDISGAAIDAKYTDHEPLSQDPDHVGSYDTQGTISLNSVMQSTVPEPYSKAPTHLNMPGGQMKQDQKYLSGKLHRTHYTTKKELHTFASSDLGSMKWHIWHKCRSACSCRMLLTKLPTCYSLIPCRLLSKSSWYRDESGRNTPQSVKDAPDNTPLTSKQKLQAAVKDYGATVIVFHVTISLISLGGCYLAVSSGLDVNSLLRDISILDEKIIAEASTFVIAYAIHKVFAPVRIGITLTATPFIVRYLRKTGFLKTK